MEIINEEPQNEPKEKRPHVVIRNTADYQRLKLEKLMQNPDKPVIIPEKPQERGSPHIPDFVRNVMGSSAGAGSGEFHVYRHLRRKEYARQKYMQAKADREKKDEEYRQKLEEYKKQTEERTAKNRAKRLKRKNKQNNKAKKPRVQKKDSSSEELTDSDEQSNGRCDNKSSNLETGTREKDIAKDSNAEKEDNLPFNPEVISYLSESLEQSTDNERNILNDEANK